MSAEQAALQSVEATIDTSVERLMDLIRIPSISTDPAHADDCRRAAQWLCDELTSLGFDASVRPTGQHPMVVAHDRDAPAGVPHVLFYGHYDVQPVDPIALWQRPPFEPARVPQPDGDSWITGRGASDDKGQLMTFIEACRAFKAANGTLPLKVSILLEGEEEIASPSLAPFLEATAQELKADVVLVCDTDMWDKDTPAITTMMRGLVGEEITVTCADRDLHSGIFGNAAANPLQVLANVLASLRAPDGSIAIEGFYDDVKDLPEAVRAQWSRLPFDAEGFLGMVGLSQPAGEADRPVIEQVWARPSFEVHGIQGGFTGNGFKTVIPSTAMAKVSFRIVDGQDPDKVRAAFRDHCRARVPADCTIEFAEHGGSAATVQPHDSPMLNRALAALTEEWQTEAACAGTGGSIPIVTAFKDQLGMDALLVGFARFDNRIHSPNEKYDLSSYHKGIRSWVRIMAKLAEG
ncbi:MULTISPECIES: M20/M25/M40 family metallo-hydrolase [unclassified Roseitalea]|uniref:M20/M25/M40 family metallo-hydrolase n=1 Tax=unclassified Roseitalea TaxID=2639107 RepID=UPI00273F3EDA|nr:MULTISPECIES: M20/M25/M40 family metallo-hydrolase [unclassified Roseitalea]